MELTKVDVVTLNRALLALRIPHGNFKSAYERGQELMYLRDHGMPGSGLMVFGPSGVGKSTLTHALVAYGHRQFGPDSVIRVQLTSGATIKGMISSLLFGFGDPRPNSGTAQELSHRLKETIRARGCRLIIIDEVQHLIPGGRASALLKDNILNTFKILDDTGVSFLLAGMESIMQLWEADAQIRSRFQTTYFLNTLIYPQDRPTWRGIIKKYVETIEAYGMSVNCEDVDDRLYAACKGAMRPLTLILTSAVSLAAQAGELIIRNEHLRLATEKQIDRRDGLPNAFDVDLQKIAGFNMEAHTIRKLAPVERGLDEILSQ